jgi:hypothetical protein
MLDHSFFGIVATERSSKNERYMKDIPTAGCVYTKTPFSTKMQHAWRTTPPRDGDTFKPFALVFSHGSIQPDLSDLTFAVQIAGTDLITVPVRLLQAIGSTDVGNGETVVKFDFRTFIEFIPLIRIVYHEIHVILRSQQKPIAEYGITGTDLICAYAAFDSKVRRKMAKRDEYEQYMQCLLAVWGRGGSENVKIDLAGKTLGLCRGFMIEGIAIEALTGYELSCAGGVVRYDAAMIRAIGQMIDKTCIFLPFNAVSNFETNHPDNFAGSVDFETDRMKGGSKTLQLSFRTVEAAAAAKVYAVCINRIKTRSGMGGILHNITQTGQALEPTTLIQS